MTDRGALFVDITHPAGGWVRDDGARNPWRPSPDYGAAVVEIALQHKGRWAVSYIDADRHADIRDVRWCAKAWKQTVYIVGYLTETQKKVRLHRHLFPMYEICDHINGKGYDNRGVNVRDGSGGINGHNVRTKTMGVHRCKGRNRYSANASTADGKRLRVYFPWTPGNTVEKKAQKRAANIWVAARKKEAIDELLARQQQRRGVAIVPTVGKKKSK